MATISKSKIELVCNLYHKEKKSMREVGEALGVSLDAVVHFMRRHRIQRRSFSEMNAVRFEHKKPSFTLRSPVSPRAKELSIAGAMLYWGEGYKSTKATCVDFANSDPEMVKVFLQFLRSVYRLDEHKFRVLLYCYADQNVQELIRFWITVTQISARQFTKPYVRKDFRADGRKMQHGLVHIRYIDKKLLLNIKRLIERYKERFHAQVVP